MNRNVDAATEHELRAFLKHRKKSCGLPTRSASASAFGGAASRSSASGTARPRCTRTRTTPSRSCASPIKLVCVGEEAPSHVALLQSLLCPGDEVLPVSTVELPLGDGQSCLAQLWAPETSEAGKPLRSAIYECAEAFLLAFDVHDAGTLQTLVAAAPGGCGAFGDAACRRAEVVLVGVVRGSGHGGAERLTAAQASALARLGVSRYVEAMGRVARGGGGAAARGVARARRARAARPRRRGGARAALRAH